MALVNAQDLDRRITILRAATIDDGFNEREGPFEVAAQRWASKKDVSDVEQRRAAEQGASVTTRFVVRWDEFTTTITPKDRISYGGSLYTISGVKEIGRREGREITAAARTDL